MLTEERQEFILTELEDKNIIKITELLSPLEASESTIRRDLQSLEEQGLLTRIHGGAKKKQSLHFEASMTEKEKRYHSEKMAIAKAAAKLIKHDDVIYIDAGTTTLEIIPFIPDDLSITVVTNSVKHASLLIEREISTYILGGRIKQATNAVLGSTVIEQLRQLRIDKAFLGMNGAHLEAGYTTPDPEEAAVKKLAMNQSGQSYVLIDPSKIEEVTFTKVAPLDAAEMITTILSEEILDEYQQQTAIMEVEVGI